MNIDEYWMSQGRHRGVFVHRAAERIQSVSSAGMISIDVLEAVVNDDRLVSSLVFKELLNDVKLGRFGVEWHMERNAMAEQTVDDFRTSWPNLREHFFQNQLVAMASSLENFVISLLVEFPPFPSHLASEPNLSDIEIEKDWQRADKSYRAAVKTLHSASGAWVLLCGNSSIPNQVKNAVAEWGKCAVKTNAVNEAVLLRNAIVHRAGMIGDRLAECKSPIKWALGGKITITRETLKRLSNAYMDFVLTIDTPL